MLLPILPFCILMIVPSADVTGEAAWPAHARDIQANDWTASTQSATTVEVLPGTAGFVVAWDSRRQQRGYYGVYARRFDLQGRPLGSEICLNAHGTGDQMRPAMAVDADGVWCAWQSFGQDGDRGAIIARRFDHQLRARGAEIVVNTVHRGHQSSPVVTSGPDGHAVIAWRDTSSQRLHLRMISAAERPGTERIIDAPPQARERRPTVSAWSDGRFVMAWQRRIAEGAWHIMVQRFTADGTPDGVALRVTPDDGRHRVDASVATTSNDAFTLAWATSGDPDHTLHVQHFVGRTPAHAPVTIDRGTATGLTGLALATRDDGYAAVLWGSHHDGATDIAGRLIDARGHVVGPVRRITDNGSGAQRLDGFTGATRARWHGRDQFVVAWSGDASAADSSAAHITLMSPAQAVETATVDGAGKQLTAAAPHVPPTYDPGRPAVDRGLIAAAEGPSDDGGFIGIVETGWNPPDPVIAVGPDHVVLMTNGAIAFFDKAGTPLFETSINDDDGFWGEVGAGFFVFDPEALYDPPSGRFFAMANERTNNMSYLLLAVSDDSNPEGTWHKYRFDVTAEANGDNDIDSPNMAVDSTTVLLTADFFGPDKYLIYAIDKQAVLDGLAPTTNSTLWIGRNSLGSTVMPDGDAPAHYLVEAFFGASSDMITLVAVTDPLTTMTIDEFDLTVPTYQAPEEPPSLGTSQRIETFEARFWSCMYRNGSLWATHHVGNGRVVQRWYEIDMNGWPTSGMSPELVQSGDIDLGAEVRTYFGAIWTDAAGDTSVLFARSSPDEYISMARTSRQPEDPPGTMNLLTILKASTATIDGDRWGDYCGVVEDPVHAGVFWGHHEYFTGIWQTWVAPFGSTCASVADCADIDGNGIRDSGCVWWACAAGTCMSTEVPFADMGGQFGLCPPDGSADSNDRFHALNCFANEDPTEEPPNSYPCETAPPAAFNVDAGGPFGDCNPDGTCDGNDAFHALGAFDGSSPCTCPLDGGPAPTPRTATVRHGTARLRLEAERKQIHPGEQFDVRVYLEELDMACRGYQLHLGVSGGRAGGLRLVDIATGVPARGRKAKLRRQADDDATAAAWSAFNATTAQMVTGWDEARMLQPGVHIATFSYQVSPTARGTFVIEVLHDANDPAARTYIFGADITDRITISKPPALEMSIR